MAVSSWRDIPGWFDFEDFYRDVAAGATAESVLLEVGSWRGRSIIFLAQELQQLGKRPRLLAAIDTWTGSVDEAEQLDAVRDLGGPEAFYLDFLNNMVSCGVRHLVRPLRMASLEAARLFQPGTVDFCFIDAQHSYDAVLADVRAWRPAIRAGGLLAGHDADYPRVSRALQDAGLETQRRGRCWTFHC